MPKAFKSWPKSNKSPNLVTLLRTKAEQLYLIKARQGGWMLKLLSGATHKMIIYLARRSSRWSTRWAFQFLTFCRDCECAETLARAACRQTRHRQSSAHILLREKLLNTNYRSQTKCRMETFCWLWKGLCALELVWPGSLGKKSPIFKS